MEENLSCSMIKKYLLDNPWIFEKIKIEIMHYLGGNVAKNMGTNNSELKRKIVGLRAFLFAIPMKIYLPFPNT